MNRVGWIGVFVLFLSCGGESQHSLKTLPKDSRSKSIDTDKPFIHLQLIAEVNEAGTASYSLKWDSNIESTEAIFITAHDQEIFIESIKQSHSLPLNADAFESLSAGPIHFMKADSRQNLHLTQISSSKILSESPYPSIAERDLVNCDHPSIRWLRSSPELPISIRLTRNSTSQEYFAEGLADSGRWNEGFRNGELYTQLFSPEELQEELFFDYLHEQISRQLPPQEITWLGSQKNLEVQVHVESLQKQSRYLYHFEECL